jgi:hypothetical protein
VSDHSTPADLAELLSASATAIAAGADLDSVVQQLLEGAASLTDARQAALFRREPDGTALRLGATVGFPPEALGAFAAEVQGDPGHPIAVAAREGRPAIGRVGSSPDGTSMTGVDLPLLVRPTASTSAWASSRSDGPASDPSTSTSWRRCAPRPTWSR